tara:strand:- start:301 stop:486 length:186 start_codon:yes stop_codon:yes gene_type:complete
MSLKYLNAKTKIDILIKRDENSFREIIKFEEKQIFINRYNKKNNIGNVCLGRLPFRYINKK